MYGLKRDYFLINPKKEYDVFFVREKEFDRFIGDVRATINSGRVPRYVVFGFYGVGKTQFLLHLKAKLTEAECIYVEMPSCHRRSRFVEFYRTVIMGLGRRRIFDTLSKGIDYVNQDGKSPSTIGLSEEVADIISRGLESDEFTLWRWLTGQKLSVSDAKSIEAVTQELGDDNAVAILNALSILNKRFTPKPLLFLIDEFESTMHISGDARVSFTEAMRSLVDEGSGISVIFALTARSIAELPSAIADEPVKRRIGITNYVTFREYNESELERFIHQVIDYRRDDKFKVADVLSSLQSSEIVTEETYPFSEEAIEEIVKSVILFKEQGKIDAVRPKEALEIMDKALRTATGKALASIDKATILNVRDQVVEALKL